MSTEPSHRAAGSGAHAGMSASPAEACFHGGAFFAAIGEDLADLERHAHVLGADVLDAWFPPAPAAGRALRGALPWAMRTSPPTDAAGLVRAIAEARGVPPACVLPGARSSSLIFLAFRSWLTPDSRVLVLDPTCGEYAHVAERVVGCAVEQFSLRREDRYRVPLDRLRERVQRGYDLVVLVNPNNPTGQHVPREDLLGPLRSLPPGTRGRVDEACMDYLGPGESVERHAASTPQVVVCKSLSKGLALSGLRVACLVGAEEVVRELRRWTPPWAVSLPAQLAAVRALQSPDHYAAADRRTRDLAKRLAGSLRSIAPDGEVIPPVANRVVWHLPARLDPRRVSARCRRRGLFLREIDGARADGGRALRIAVKDPRTLERMADILTEAVAETDRTRRHGR